MRPSGLTCVASKNAMPGPESANWPRLTRCQSFALPSTAEYWHIGETTRRFSMVSPRMVSGRNRWEALVVTHAEFVEVEQHLLRIGIDAVGARLDEFLLAVAAGQNADAEEVRAAGGYGEQE